jgi:hypothetical protein
VSIRKFILPDRFIRGSSNGRTSDSGLENLMPGGVMVTRLTLDQDTQGSSPCPAANLVKEMDSEKLKVSESIRVIFASCESNVVAVAKRD